jgi:phenylalanyl-tRNA synthetase beta chain
MRTHMLPGLAQIATYNLAHGVAGGQVFEIGRVYWPERLPLTAQPCERMHLAALWFGQTEAGFGAKARSYDFYDAKGVIETWLTALGLGDQVRFETVEQTWLHPGRSAQAMIGDERIGTFGELHPETAQALDLGQTLYAEFDLDALLPYLGAEWKVAKLPKYPAVRRDLAVLVDQPVPAGALLQTVQTASAGQTEDLLESVHVFDVYAGKGVPDGQKSIALALWFRHLDRTLTDDEVDEAVSAILKALAQSHKAVLRG